MNQDVIIDGFLRDHELAVITMPGKANSGKSMLGYQIYTSISQGADFLGMSTVRSSALYVDIKDSHRLHCPLDRIEVMSKMVGGNTDGVELDCLSIVKCFHLEELLQREALRGRRVAVISHDLFNEIVKNSGSESKAINDLAKTVEAVGMSIVVVKEYAKESLFDMNWNPLPRADDTCVVITENSHPHQRWVQVSKSFGEQYFDISFSDGIWKRIGE